MQAMELISAPGLLPGRCFRCGSIGPCVDTRIDMNEFGGAWRIYVCERVCAPEIARLIGGLDAEQAHAAKQRESELLSVIDELESRVEALRPAAELLDQIEQARTEKTVAA
jgi:hypothetical protein